jgi:hypothetical protein
MADKKHASLLWLFQDLLDLVSSIESRVHLFFGGLVMDRCITN